MTDIRVTHIGGPTVLIEVNGWRFLTDPTFDAPGRRYTFGWGSASRKATGPAVAAADVGPIDAVLLSHDHHADNLDDAGRALLPTAGRVITTVAGAQRMGGNADGLQPWSTMTLEAPDRQSILLTATPCRHGPPASRPITGDVIGFSLTWAGQQHGALWISGDTVLYPAVRQVADRINVGTALLHLGGVQFGVTGPIRYTMTAKDGVELLASIRPHTTIPIHYEGWSHFKQRKSVIEKEFRAAPPDIRDTVTWLRIGLATEIAV
jgi:L-ascorbate metabolism protein UlaG (beta-lactamase superfamily)